MKSSVIWKKGNESCTVLRSEVIVGWENQERGKGGITTKLSSEVRSSLVRKIKKGGVGGVGKGRAPKGLLYCPQR